jgi:glutaconyl-CoA/methylmalonyl-CoA decarboxylase subunit gamma
MELRKKYILRANGEDTEATLLRDSNGRVWVENSNGEAIDDAMVLDEGRTVSLRHRGRMYLVDVTPRRAKSLRALVNGEGGLVEILDELAAAAADRAGSTASARELRSDMPGMVVEVKCEVGDSVSKGGAIIVLEAMKMQNELGAPGDGVIEEVLVTAGQSVESGALLVRLAPETDSQDIEKGEK